jgi:sensor histidine kinase YesM
MAAIPDRLRWGPGFTDVLIFRNRWWQHLFFWAAVLLVLLNIFKTSSSIEKIDLIYTLIFMAPLVALTCLNLYYFIPGDLVRGRYLLYLFFFILLTGGGALFLYFLFDRWIDIVMPEYYFISYYSVGQLSIFTGSILLLTTLLKLSRSWLRLMRVERMTTSHRLKSLQSQINPHFLLNSLQTIYALSLEKSDRTPDVILRLSDILKYTLYDTEYPLIGLDQEYSLVTDYVEMYRLRTDPGKTGITLELEGNTGGYRIAPMLLIPFVENSFKHGLRSGVAGAFIHIRLKTEQGVLEFSATNNAGAGEQPEAEQKKGIGIENTRQRLELLYPGRHWLKIKQEEQQFSVSLKLKLDT